MSNTELLTLLAKHSSWASSNGFSGRKVSFHAQDFTGMTFEDQNFSYADFTGSILKNVTFKNCKLHRCNFNDCVFENTKFLDCGLADTGFNTDITSCSFFGSDIQDSDRLMETIHKYQYDVKLQIGKLYQLSKLIKWDIRRHLKPVELPDEDIYYAVYLGDSSDNKISFLVQDVVVRDFPWWAKLWAFQEIDS